VENSESNSSAYESIFFIKEAVKLLDSLRSKEGENLVDK
jgi:hypothetical protein